MSRKEPKAVVWDMDGVIANTAPYHFRAWRQVFQKRGVNFTEADFKHNFGQRNDTIIKNTMGQDTPQNEIEIITQEKEASFRNMARHQIKSLPGAIALLEALARHGFKMALASSAPMANIRLVITSLGIKDYFPIVVSGRDVTEGKPSPQGFLLAARRLGIKPKSCIVVEDAIAGVAAAKKAGMHCLAVTNTHPRKSLLAADLIVDTLAEVEVNKLEGLIN